mmetsp:Transcript_98360/g.169516  ORF Transcript_98360/g.169516 Transcript_98360/m.169516 type:complete len:230 (-) Transcript_98360:1115-1804(-)
MWRHGAAMSGTGRPGGGASHAESGHRGPRGGGWAYQYQWLAAPQPCPSVRILVRRERGLRRPLRVSAAVPPHLERRTSRRERGGQRGGTPPGLGLPASVGAPHMPCQQHTAIRSIITGRHNSEHGPVPAGAQASLPHVGRHVGCTGAPHWLCSTGTHGRTGSGDPPRRHQHVCAGCPWASIRAMWESLEGETMASEAPAGIRIRVPGECLSWRRRGRHQLLLVPLHQHC